MNICVCSFGVFLLTLQLNGDSIMFGPSYFNLLIILKWPLCYVEVLVNLLHPPPSQLYTGAEQCVVTLDSFHLLFCLAAFYHMIWVQNKPQWNLRILCLFSDLWRACTALHCSSSSYFVLTLLFSHTVQPLRLIYMSDTLRETVFSIFQNKTK